MNASDVSESFNANNIHVILANVLGMLTSVIFTGMYFPQFLLNKRRRSTEGFSSTGIQIKLVGAAFLAVNAYVTGEALPVVAYGALNIIQHDAFMVQFFLYEKPQYNLQYLLFLLCPVVPYLLAVIAPATMSLTNFVKPVSQVASHIPQLLECRKWRTTAGVALMSQHMNFIGGILGIYMCYVIPPKSVMPWLLYINSLLQASTLYFAWFWYDSGYIEKHKGLPITFADEKD